MTKRFPRSWPLSILLTGACMGCPQPPAEDPGKTAADAAVPTVAPEDMIMEAPGVDIKGLTDAQRESFFQLLNTEPSACDKPHSLAKSLQEDKDCRDSMSIGQVIADALSQGISVSDLRLELPSVRDALKPKEIPVEGRPMYGNERAPVTVVVFADFQCPHCAAEAPVLRKAIQQFRGQARLVYRHFPLSAHPYAARAAVATEAAFEQGKFWEMHDLVFDAQNTLYEDPDKVDAKLRGFAEKLGLDLVKYDAYMASDVGTKVVEGDRAEGEKLKITGTPAVFINGRYFHPILFGGTVNGWIEDALRR